MPDNQNESRKVFGVIMFADIVGSSKLSAELSDDAYDEMIREYHLLSSEAIDRYCTEEGISDDKIVKRAYGDEIFLVLYADVNVPNDIQTVLKHILNLAVMIRTEWVNSEFNKDRPDIVDIRIGIGGGWLKVRPSVWDQGETPEGLPITKTKRIEGCANDERFQKHKTNILIQGDLLQHTPADIGVKLGKNALVAIDLKGERPVPVAVVPISDYQELQEKYLMERGKPADSAEAEAYLSYRAGEFDSKNPLHQLYSGSDYYNDGNFDAAISAYRRAIELKPDYAEAYNNIGTVFDYQGDFGAAIEMFEKTVYLNPDPAEAFYNMGVAHGDKVDLDAAIVAYRKAIELKPTYAEAHYNLGNALSDKGNFPAAAEAFRNAINLKPDWVSAHYNLGVTLFKQCDYNAAITCLEKAIELKSNLPEAFVYIGEALFKKRKFNAAVVAFRKAIELEPSDAELYDRLGVALGKMGDHVPAIEMFEKALDINPDDAKARNNLAIAKRKKQQADENS